MLQCSKLMSKIVISIYDCQEMGKVDFFYIAKGLKLKYVQILHNGLTYLIATRDLIARDKDCITIRNASVLHLKDTLDCQLLGCSTILGIKCYSIDGEYLGAIKDAYFDKLVLAKLVLTNGQEYTKKDVLQISQDLCIISAAGQSGRISSYRPKGVPRPKADYNNITVEISNPINAKSATNTLPQKIVCDIPTLLHRTTTKAILANNGEVIVRAFTKLTREHINKARMYGKLYELMKYSNADSCTQILTTSHISN